MKKRARVGRTNYRQDNFTKHLVYCPISVNRKKLGASAVQCFCLNSLAAVSAAESGKHIAVSHKAVIRSVLSLAYDWPMLDKPPVKLDWTCLHLFTLDADGRPRPRQMNLPLERA